MSGEDVASKLASESYWGAKKEGAIFSAEGRKAWVLLLLRVCAERKMPLGEMTDICAALGVTAEELTEVGKAVKK